MNVAELIDKDTRTWKYGLIHQMFNTRDTREIMKLPLNLVSNDDQPIWRCSKRGSYIARSAYYQVTQVITDNSRRRAHGNWMKFWKLQVPQKVRLFLWWVLQNVYRFRVD
ncbi:hypothetical protein QL285_034039 [Trifolium repens]|nr:hypothetical protein QL285_034039 [Trifolium repens]